MATLLLFFIGIQVHAGFPADFIELKEVDDSIIQDIRLAGSHNFVGHPIAGYKAPKCILTWAAAKALKDIQKELKAKSFSLKVYDCYRPQKAVDALVKWAQDPKDLKMKDEFYPREDKKNLFVHGYLALKSSHCRGSAVDVTLVKLPPAKEEVFEGHLKGCAQPVAGRFGDNSLDMGTGFDCFDAWSATDNWMVPWEQRENRKFLKSIMEKHGFENLKSEWWHYTLQIETHPKEYFDFDIK